MNLPVSDFSPPFFFFPHFHSKLKSPFAHCVSPPVWTTRLTPHCVRQQIPAANPPSSPPRSWVASLGAEGTPSTGYLHPFPLPSWSRRVPARTGCRDIFAINISICSALTAVNSCGAFRQLDLLCSFQRRLSRALSLLEQ